MMSNMLLGHVQTSATIQAMYLNRGRDNRVKRDSLASELLDTLPFVIYLVDWKRKRINYFNQMAADFFKFSRGVPARLSLNTIETRLHPADRHAYRKMLAHSQGIEAQTVQTLEMRLMSRQCDWRWMLCWIITVNHTAHGSPSQILYCCEDITARKALEEQLRRQCYLDTLTGLYNRAYFAEELARLEKGRDYPLALMMIDVDDFKQINDRFGHQTGDEMLQELAHILKAAFRDGDVIARIGGDEFAVILPNTDDATLKRIVARVRYALHQRNNANLDHSLRISIGTAIGQRGEKLAPLLRRADEAMYRHKQQTKAHPLYTASCNVMKSAN
jgi:diguanylate cyclase (GGDEF)-like protein